MVAVTDWIFPNGARVTVNPPYYPASCDRCGWQGSSEDCSSCEADDVYCPVCHQSGADCGKAGESARPALTAAPGEAGE